VGYSDTAGKLVNSFKRVRMSIVTRVQHGISKSEVHRTSRLQLVGHTHQFIFFRRHARARASPRRYSSRGAWGLWSDREGGGDGGGGG